MWSAKLNATHLKAVAVVVASGVAFKLLKNLSWRCDTSDTTVNEIMFYGGENNQRAKDAGLNNIMCIYYIVVHAYRTIDVCVPSIISPTIAECLINATKNEVKIRVAIHNSRDFTHLQSLAENGIEVKVINVVNAHLAHEFILVDASEDFDGALAVIGSIDYETTRVNLNRDSTMLTSDQAVVRVLKKEFDRIWESLPNSSMAIASQVKLIK